MPSPAIEAFAGAVGGCTALATTYPLQTIASLAQMHNKAPERELKRRCEATTDSASEDSVGHEDETPIQGKGSFEAVLEIIKKEGVGRLYRGLGSALWGQMVIQAVYYYFYSAAQRMLMSAKGGKALTTLDHTLAATLAGATGATLTNPIWVVATRAIKTGSKKGTVPLLKELYEEDGLAGLFRGLGPALILVSNPTIQYSVFEKLKQLFTKSNSKLGNGELFVLGAMGKIAATLVTYPYIMAKTTLQSQTDKEDSATHYSSTGQCLVGVYEREGLGGLYSGLNSKLWQSVLTAALLFVLQKRCLQLVVYLLKKTKRI